MTANNELRRYLAILLRWSWLLVLSALLAGAVAYVLSKRQTPLYQASTTILIEEAPGTSNQTDYNSILTSERRARTYAELLKATPLLEAVVQKLNLPMDAGTLGDAVSVQPVRDTQLIRVQVEDTNPQRSAEIANTLVAVFAEQRQIRQSSRYAASRESLQSQLAILEKQIEQTEQSLAGTGAGEQPVRDRLETLLVQYRQSYANLLQSFEQIRIAEAQSTSNVVQEEPAVDAEQVAPRVLRTTALAAIVGLLVALGMVFLREALDDRVKDPEALSRLLELPVLGFIARSRRSENAGPVVTAEPRSPAAEAYRALRTNIEFTSVDRPLRTLLVTSPSPGDGKSTTAANLGLIMGQGGRKVILVDTDLRRPTVHKLLDLSNRSGLSELFVQHDVRLNGELRSSSVANVSAMTAGVLPPNPAELLGSQKMVDILGEAQKQADLVVIDSPPVTVVTDAAVLAQRVDGVLLVVRAGQTRMSACQHAVEQLRRVGAHMLGVVVNDIPVGRSGYGYAYQGYYQYYRDPEHEQATESPRTGLRKLLGRKSRPSSPVERQS